MISFARFIVVLDTEIVEGPVVNKKGQKQWWLFVMKAVMFDVRTLEW